RRPVVGVTGAKSPAGSPAGAAPGAGDRAAVLAARTWTQSAAPRCRRRRRRAAVRRALPAAGFSARGGGRPSGLFYPPANHGSSSSVLHITAGLGASLLRCAPPERGGKEVGAEMKCVVIPGDGIGPEVVRATQKILDASGAGFEWIEAEAGLESVARHGTGLPQ